MESEKLKIGVIFGGLSAEREVSLVSGRHVYQILDRNHFDPVPIFFDSGARFWKIPESLVIRNTTKELEENLLIKGARTLSYEELPGQIDLAFLTTHGKYGDDGCLQGLLELLKIPYTGSGVLSAALGMDKPMQRKLLSASEEKINSPEYIVFRKEIWKSDKDKCISEAENKFSYPIVTKPAREGSTLGVMVVREKKDWDEALRAAFEYDNSAVVEKYLEGREFSVIVVGNEDPIAFLPTETIHEGKIFTYDHKYLPGGSQKITPMEIKDEIIGEIQRQAVGAYKILECKTFARIDGFVLKDGKVLITDPNSAASTGLGPSSWTFHQAALNNLSPKDFLTSLVEFSLEAHKFKKGAL